MYFKILKNRIFCTVALVLFFNCAFGKNYFVHSEGEFNAINSSLRPGDDVTIANGNYPGWNFKLSCSGTARKPIYIHAQTPGQVIFSGIISKTLFQVGGDYIWINGFVMQDCNLIKIPGKVNFLVEIKNASYCTISNCQFARDTVGGQYRPIVVIAGNGKYNEIDSCSFISNFDNQDVQIRITKDDCPTYTQINNNLFKDKSKGNWPVYNGGECIQVGQDQINLGNTEAKATVRNNKFINCFGDTEIVSNKSSDNTYIGNYFEGCGGELVLRGGYGCVVDSNTFVKQKSAIRVSGTGHTITNNRISDTETGIRLMYGTRIGREAKGIYVAASGCTVRKNHFNNTKVGVVVGGGKGGNVTGQVASMDKLKKTLDIAPANNQVDQNEFLNSGNNNNNNNKGNQ